jgi:hypothetical protein
VAALDRLGIAVFQTLVWTSFLLAGFALAKDHLRRFVLATPTCDVAPGYEVRERFTQELRSFLRREGQKEGRTAPCVLFLGATKSRRDCVLGFNGVLIAVYIFTLFRPLPV